MQRPKEGKVYLVGAGPGDIGLITVKGLNCIRESDVVVYDNLANERFLKEMKKGAKKIYVGKKIGNHILSQEEINKLLVENAKKGKIITRLKGGDPFIFGRGGEEALYLRKNGIQFEVISGVTSAISAPTYAGIPITHRGLSSSIAIVTGHEDPKKEFSQVKWDKIASCFDTLIILMGMKNISFITEILMKNGLSPEKETAVIQWGSTPSQKTVTGKLKDISAIAEKSGLDSPSVIVIGDVVSLRDELKWFEKKPLFGKRILITRPENQTAEISNLLLNEGADVIEFPLIKTVFPYTWKFLDKAINNVEKYDWIIFTSVNGVKYFFHRFFKITKDIRSLGGVKICAIGSATAKMIKDFHLNVEMVPRRFTSSAIIKEFSKMKWIKNKRFLLPRANIGGESLPQGLKKLGCQVDEIEVYRTLPVKRYNSDYVEMIKNGKVNIITFTSSSTVRSFMEMAKKYNVLGSLSNLSVVSIGPETSKTAREYGLTVASEAKISNVSGLFEAIMSLDD